MDVSFVCHPVDLDDQRNMERSQQLIPSMAPARKPAPMQLEWQASNPLLHGPTPQPQSSTSTSRIEAKITRRRAQQDFVRHCVNNLQLPTDMITQEIRERWEVYRGPIGLQLLYARSRQRYTREMQHVRASPHDHAASYVLVDDSNQRDIQSSSWQSLQASLVNRERARLPAISSRGT